MVRFIILIIILIAFAGCNRKKISLESLLTDLCQRETLTYFPVNEYKLIQASSYNRASVSPDSAGWFANADMSRFIRIEEKNGRREFVMLDTEGPGAIVRWWMTFYKAQEGIIRVYIDNASEPVFEGSPDSLLSGPLLAGYPFSVSLQKGAPLGEEGRDYDHNFYLPVPFSNHCKITYECDSLRILYDYEGITVEKGYYWPDVFYNICYRSYNKGTRVESFSMQALTEAKPLIEKAGILLMDTVVNSSEENLFGKLLPPGDSLVIRLTGDHKAINMLAVEIGADNKNQALRSVIIKAAFDGNQTLWAPVGEFFGSGYSLNTHQTRMNMRDKGGIMSSFWVMPFRKKCAISFINYGTDTIDLKGGAGLMEYKWSDRSMYFGASWHQHYRIRSRGTDGCPFDLSFADIKGKGVYAGDQITIFNNTYHWWGEGDEKIFVDGEKFPSSFGTGSEDYYGYSFARQESFSHPFLSQPVGTGNMDWGPTLNMRHRSLDAIPFNNSINPNIELWHWKDIEMNYALTAYYYIFPGYSNSIVPDTESVKLPVSLTKEDFNGFNNK